MSDIQEEQKRLYKKAEENDYGDLLRKYNNLKTALDESQEVVISYKEENEQLKDLCDKYEEEHKTTFEEWKKDINIIDELEKYLEYRLSCSINGIRDDEIKKVMNKLNELKRR